MEIGKITLSALFIAVGAILTKMFFLTGAGVLFLYIAVLICGLTLGPKYGFITGILVPVTAFFVTGMITPVLMFRIVPAFAVYGLVLGIYMNSGSCKNHCNTKIYTAILIATFASRIVIGAITALFFEIGTELFSAWLILELIGALPTLIFVMFSARMMVPIIRRVNGFKYLPIDA